MQIPDPFDPNPVKLEVVQEPANKEPQPKYKKDDKTAKLVSELIKAASACDQLRVQAHLIHFNYESSNFVGIHELLQKLYEDHSKQLDRLGELVRSMDYLMPMCDKGLRSAYKDIAHCSSYEPGVMLHTYYTNLETFAMSLKKVRKQAATLDAPDVDHYLAELIGDLFKASWMLKASLR